MAKKKKKKVSKRKIRNFILVLILILLIIGVIFGLKSSFTNKKKAQADVKVEDKLEDYGYELMENESKYYKDLFNELKGVLSESEVDEEKYASLVGQLFLSDFFHLKNKISRNDIGGTGFVYESYRSDFEKKAKDGVYRYVESNIYGDRKQDLPEVASVSIDNIEQIEYEYLDEVDDEAYSLDATISYVKDMGYQEQATLILVHHNNKLEIVKMSE